MKKIGRTVIKIAVIVLVFSVLLNVSNLNVSGRVARTYFAHETYVDIQGEQWKYVTVKEANYWNYNYPRYGYEEDYGYFFAINTPFIAEAYIEKEFDIPTGISSFTLDAETFSNHADAKIILFDSNNVEHFLGRIPYQQYYKLRYNPKEKIDFDTSSYAGQRVRIRIHQTSAPDGAGWQKYRNIRIVSQSQSPNPVTTFYQWIFRIMFFLLLIIVVLYLFRARRD